MTVLELSALVKELEEKFGRFRRRSHDGRYCCCGAAPAAAAEDRLNSTPS